MSLNDLWRDLTRRKVVRAVISYAAAAFIFLQAAQLVLAALPPLTWLYTVLVVIALLGVPLVAAAAWLFEFSDGRLVRDHRPVASRGPGGRRAAAVLVLVAACMAGGWMLFGQEAVDATLDSQLVAVFPFQVRGGGDELADLPEGMVDLFTIELQGESGPRPVDPARTFALLAKEGVGGQEVAQAELLQLARQLGAGRALTGRVIATGSQVVVNGSLLPVGIGRRVDATAEGSLDSLATLVRRVARALLTRDAGEREDRLGLLAGTSTDALRDYLRGQAEYRKGNFRAARDAYQSALSRDSSFALAGLGVLITRGWAGAGITAAQRRTAQAAAWRGRDHFSEVDRATLYALVGCTGPAAAHSLAQNTTPAPAAPPEPRIE